MVDDSSLKEMRSMMEFSELHARHPPVGKTFAENTELSLDFSFFRTRYLHLH